MIRLFYLLIFTTAPFAFGQEADPNNPVYNRQSQLSVNNINRVVEILRNPTVMSGNFRQALKDIAPTISSASASVISPSGEYEENDMPIIALVGKMITPDMPPSVVIRVNKSTFHLSEGRSASQLVNNKIVNIRVDKITENNVTIFLSPFEQVMVLQ